MNSKEKYDNLEKAIFHYWAIGELLIDVSKGYISEDIALKKIKEYMHIADVFSHKDLRTIKRDLSVLEIIKKYYDIEVTYTGLKISYKKDAPMSYSGFAEEERKTIEEWLKNEK